MLVKTLYLLRKLFFSRCHCYGGSDQMVIKCHLPKAFLGPAKNCCIVLGYKLQIIHSSLWEQWKNVLFLLNFNCTQARVLSWNLYNSTRSGFPKQQLPIWYLWALWGLAVTGWRHVGLNIFSNSASTPPLPSETSLEPTLRALGGHHRGVNIIHVFDVKLCYQNEYLKNS